MSMWKKFNAKSKDVLSKTSRMSSGWQSDGTFLKPYNWIVQRDNNVDYTAEQQEQQDENSRLGIEQCYNVNGLNKLLDNMNANNFVINNLGYGNSPTDSSNMQNISDIYTNCDIPIRCKVADSSTTDVFNLDFLNPSLRPSPTISNDGAKIVTFTATKDLVSKGTITFGDLTAPVMSGTNKDGTLPTRYPKCLRSGFTYTLKYIELKIPTGTYAFWINYDNNPEGAIIGTQRISTLIPEYVPPGYLSCGFVYTGRALETYTAISYIKPDQKGTIFKILVGGVGGIVGIPFRLINTNVGSDCHIVFVGVNFIQKIRPEFFNGNP